MKRILFSLFILVSLNAGSQFVINSAYVWNGCAMWSQGTAQVSYNDPANAPPYTIEVWHQNPNPWPPVIQATSISNNNVDNAFLISGGSWGGPLLIYVINANGDTAIALHPGPPNNTMNPTAHATNCNPGPGDVHVYPGGGTPPYLYSDDQSNWQTSNVFPGAGCSGAGSYYVQDASGCEVLASWPVPSGGGGGGCTKHFVFQTIAVSSFGICDGELTWIAQGLDTLFDHELHITGPNGYDSTWVITGSDTIGTITGLCAGGYFGDIDEDSTCTDATSNSIQSPPEVLATAQISTQQFTGCSNCDGGIKYSIADQMDKIPSTVNLYKLDGGQVLLNSFINSYAGINHQYDSLCPGNYMIEVIDVNLDTSYVLETIDSIQNPLTIGVGSTIESNYNIANGGITLTATGGIPPYEYSLNNGVDWQSNPDFSGLQGSATYDYSIKDAGGCILYGSIWLADTNFCVTNIFGSSSDYICTGTCNGEISWAAQASHPITTYNITLEDDQGGIVQQGTFAGASNSGAFSNLCAGSYSVIVDHDGNCPYTKNYNVFPYSQDTLDIVNHSFVQPTFGMSDGTITIHAGGGNAPYEFSMDGITWSSDSVFTNLSDGNYWFFLRDANGCIDSTEIVLNELPDASTISDNSFSNVLIYPNPTQGQLNVEFEGEFQFIILNHLGQIVMTGNSINKSSIDMNDFEAGHYTIQIISDDRVIVKTFILQ